MRRVTVAAAALITAVGLAACGGSEQAATVAPTQTEPPASGPSAGAPIPGGGLSIQEAIDSTLAGPLMVKGFIVADGQGSLKLCSALRESYPPQCGEPSLRVHPLALESVDNIMQPADVAPAAWTPTQVSLLGDVESGVITVSSTSI
jgi:hypothetical protein